MTDLFQTNLKMIEFLIKNHPKMVPFVEKMCIVSSDRNYFDYISSQQFFGNLIRESTAQLNQDLFVLSETNFKKGGFFVEFGATNGKSLSNTFLLEKKFGWNGILAEPAKVWHKELKYNRNSIIDKRCVWTKTGEYITFNEAEEAQLATIDIFSDSDLHSDRRKSGKRYEVETISLNDLLLQHHAPFEIDYLSIDTEGSELEILRSFNFNDHRISVITCEHNNTPAREEIYKLLIAHGYQRKYENISQFDDWYVLEQR